MTSYRELIKKTYIEPIKSVVLVDDRFPTYEKLVAANLEMSRKIDEANERMDSGGRRTKIALGPSRLEFSEADRLLKVVKSFRARSSPFMVDVHDGVLSEEKIADNLHQSDLLVLDLELDDGEDSIASTVKILRHLLNSNHFNLVLIYTSTDVPDAFYRVLPRLMCRSDGLLGGSAKERAESLLFEKEADIPGLQERLAGSLSLSEYLLAREDLKNVKEMLKTGAGPFSRFSALCADANLSPDESKMIGLYILDSVERELFGGFSDDDYRLSWSNGKYPWIKGQSAFISFANKHESNTAVQLLTSIENALASWKPQPWRLLLSRLATEIDNAGTKSAEEALHDKKVLAYWYMQLLEEEDLDSNDVAARVDLHLQEFIAPMKGKLTEFGMAILEHDRGGRARPVTVCNNHFGLDVSKGENAQDARFAHNVIVSSTKPTGVNVSTGHILFDGSEEYWVCVSPICDTVPGQLSNYHAERIGNRLPFTAVRVFSISISKALERANSNSILFLKIGDEPKPFSFSPNPTDDLAGPIWRQFYADNKGVFAIGDGLQRLRAWSAKEDAEQLTMHPHDFKVVAQLRYEYALSLVNKLGGHNTRVGLDYVK